MLDMLDMLQNDENKHTLLEGACALCAAVDVSTDEIWTQNELEALTEDLLMKVDLQAPPAHRLAVLLDCFYQEWGFSGDRENVYASDNMLVESVLQRRQGGALGLGTLLIYFAQQLSLRVQGVLFPTQFLLQVDADIAEEAFFDPYQGEFVSKNTLQSWLVGYRGPIGKLTADDLKLADHAEVMGHWLANLKAAFMRERDYLMALKCVDIALTVMPEDPYEMRDRGYIYQQLECPQIAASDYDFFIENCPEDPAADMLRLQVYSLKQTQNTLH